MHRLAEKPDCNRAAGQSRPTHREGTVRAARAHRRLRRPHPRHGLPQDPPPTAAPQTEQSGSTGTGGPQGRREGVPRPHGHTRFRCCPRLSSASRVRTRSGDAERAAKTPRRSGAPCHERGLGASASVCRPACPAPRTETEGRASRPDPRTRRGPWGPRGGEGTRSSAEGGREGRVLSACFGVKPRKQPPQRGSDA